MPTILTLTKGPTKIVVSATPRSDEQGFYREVAAGMKTDVEIKAAQTLILKSMYGPDGDEGSKFSHHPVQVKVATPEMPWAAMKGSGTGSDMSVYSLDAYTAVRHVMIAH